MFLSLFEYKLWEGENIFFPLYNKLWILKLAGYPDSPITETMILIFSIIYLINSILKIVLF